MNFTVYLFVIFVITLTTSEGSGSKCRNRLSLLVSIESDKDEDGKWVTAFTAIRNTSVKPENAGLDLAKEITECDGIHMVKLQGVLREGTERKLVEADKKSEGLTFHPKTASNVAITNNGRTAVKIKKDDSFGGVVFTSRPLRNDEIFEVQLDKRGTKYSSCIGIGATIHSPDNHEILPHMNQMKTGTWMYYGENSWNNGSNITPKFGASTYTLQPGERVGVMRSRYGALHYFVKGIDQGPAATNVPEKLYGVFELYGDAQQASIVER